MFSQGDLVKFTDAPNRNVVKNWSRHGILVPCNYSKRAHYCYTLLDALKANVLGRASTLGLSVKLVSKSLPNDEASYDSAKILAYRLMDGEVSIETMYESELRFNGDAVVAVSLRGYPEIFGEAYKRRYA